MGTYVCAPERLADHLWLLRGRHDSVARRRFLCRMLADMLECEADAVVLGMDENGKPHLAAPRTGLAFNLSHREGLTLLGAAPAAIGVDVEWVEDGGDVAHVLFSPGEARWLASVDQADAFTRLWTGKEAVLKAAGRGVALGVAEPDFSPLFRPGRPFVDKTCDIGLAGESYRVEWHAIAQSGRPAIAASAVLRHAAVTFSCAPRPAPAPRPLAAIAG